MILSVLPESSRILRARCLEFNFSEPQFDLAAYAADLEETRAALDALGLSSNQVEVPWEEDGERYRVFALAGEPGIVCVNPRIVELSSAKIRLDEGCVSFPDIVLPVKRSENAKVRFQDITGETHTATFHGMTARVFQHELDHLDGVTFLDRANRVHRDRVLRKREAATRRKSQDRKRELRRLEDAQRR